MRRSVWTAGQGMLAVVLPVVLVVVPAVVLAGCGGQTSSQRPLVAAYIKRLDTIEASLVPPYRTVTRAGAAFVSRRQAGGRGGLVSAASVRRALVAIVGAGRRLAAVPVPAPALRLRQLALELIAGEAGMTEELSQLVAFLPAFERSLAPVGPATVQLQKALSVTQPQGYGLAGVNATLAVKAAALRRYQGLLGAVAAALRRLAPPPVSEPSWSSQVSTIERMGSSAGALAVALAAGRRDLTPLIRAFDAAAAGGGSVAVQRAEIAAVGAYDRRAAQLDGLVHALAVERARLARSLR